MGIILWIALRGAKMYYIYCYTNKINNHKYIGQTNNIERRKREHKCSTLNPNREDYNLLFHKKLREYGIENFTFEILEEIDSNDNNLINEREIYWIKELNSFVRNGGYNLTFGGEGTRIERKISNKEAEEIKILLENGFSTTEICNKYQIINSYLSMINNGIYFYDKNRTYPIHKYYKTDQDYEELINLLKYSELSLKQISDKLNIGYSTIKKINQGTLRKGLCNEYPVRNKSVYQMRADRVKELLLNSSYSEAEIMLETGVSQETIRRINKGETHKDDNLIYPLR